MMMKETVYKIFIFLVFLILPGMSIHAQKVIRGQVKDANGGYGLPGANIYVGGSTAGTITDSDGRFVLDVPTNTKEVIVSMIGYQTQNINVEQNTTLDVLLVESLSALDEVVVVGYGTTKKSKLIASVSKLDNKFLETGIRANPAQALSGTIAGLRVVNGSGRPGSLPNIVLRGGTNFNGTGSPLIIMDGQIRGSLSDINPEEIASMEVLKDASATAIYGARASNGVILITSKRGGEGTSAVTVKVQRGQSQLNVPYNFLSAEDYISWTRKGVVQAMINGTFGTVAANTALSAVGPRGTGNLYKDAAGNFVDGNYSAAGIWSVMRLTDVNRELLNQPGWKQMKDAVPTNAAGNYDPNGTLADLIYKDFNYGDFGLNKSAAIEDINIGFSGGNDRGKYWSNIGYYNEGGLSLKTFYKRFNFAFNGDYAINSWLKSESGIQFARATWRDESLQNGEGNYWGRMLSAPPTMRGTNANGELLLGRDASDGNPIYNIDKYKRKNQSDKFTLNQAFKVNFTKDLSIRVNGILMYDEAFNESFNQDFRTGLLNLTNPNTGWNRDRQSSSSFNRVTRQTYNSVLNYNKTFMKSHNVEAMIGAEFFESYNNGLSAGGRLAPTDDFADLQLTTNNAEQQTRSTDTYNNKERILSSFGRINYDYNGRYLASFTMRRDGYSRLLGNNRYGTFPAFSVGWLVHHEEFMKGASDWLSFMKLRGSWGRNGNIGDIGIYELQGAFGSQAAYGGTIGFLQTSVANPDLRWEKSNTIEVGADLGFFQNKINASVAVYDRITDDKIANVLLPTSSGVSSIRTNNGSMRNRGLELEATAKLYQSKDFSIQIGANAAWNKNTILQLPFNGNENNRQGGQQIFDPTTGQLIWVGGFQEGQEWGEIFGFVSEGIIRNAQDLANYNKIDLAAGQVWFNGSAGRRVASPKLVQERNLTLAGGWLSTQLGDMMWKDIDNNDTIDFKDMVSLGRQIPRWTGGFSTTLRFKGLSLLTRMDFALGHVQQDFMHMWALASAQGEFNPTDRVFDTWTPENPDATLPRYVWADQLNTKNFDRPSSMFFVPSDYLSFREVTLSYSLPKSFAKKVKMSAFNISATGQNLGYLTHSMLNLPERSGNQTSGYIIPTQFIVGINATF
jgi:TonB-linked SusC/RagA family outer membrane protein